MSEKKYVIATDTLRIHFTTIGHKYEILEEDEECYKVLDDREKENWVPKRYCKLAEE